MPPPKGQPITDASEPIAAPGRVAYSYARYSSRKQCIGSSEERQVDQARDWAKRKGVPLVEEVFDRGKSGFHGEHRKHGAFGRFLGDLKAGRVPKGSFLVIEAMNRLSREPPYDGQGTLRELLDGGIVLVVLYRDETEIDEDRARRDPRTLTELHQDIEIAYQQSKEKSDMSFRNWRRLARLIQERVGVTGRCPGWLRVVGEKRKYGKIVKHGRYERHPEHWPIVEEMVEMRMAGHGLTTIAGKLNERGVRPFQDVYKGKKTSGWTDSSVKFILRHPALYGEYRFQRKVDGVLPEPVPNYYPAVITKGKWLLLQREMDGARQTGGGKSIRAVPNLFDGILVCAVCGGPLHLSGDGPSMRYRYRRYGCDHARRKVRKEPSNSMPDGVCTHTAMWQVPLVEGILFYYLLARLRPQDLAVSTTDVTPLTSNVTRLTEELAEIDERIARAKDRLLREPDERRYQRLQDQLDAEEPKAEEVKRRLEDARQALAAAQHGDSPGRALEKLQTIASTFAADGGDEARERLRLAIRKVVDRIEVSPNPIPYYITADDHAIALGGPGKGIPRFPVCTLFLKSDKVIMTGELPPLRWQTEVMQLAPPVTPRHLRAKLAKLRERTPDPAPALSPEEMKFRDSLASFFHVEHRLESEG